MKLFTAGPVEMGQNVREMGGWQLPYFRTKEFSDIMFRIQDMFIYLLDALDGSKLVTLTASGTGGMEAAVSNLFDERDKLLVINGGTFGKRFCELCECFGIPYDELTVSFEDDLTPDMLDPFRDGGYTGMLVNIDETSIGKLYDYKMLGEFCRQNGMLFVVDAISSFLADELSMKAGNIDVVILSSQKALALPPGLSYVLLGKRAIKERIGRIKRRSVYFDFSDYIRNMERGQTPFTPAVGIVLQTECRLKEIIDEGLEAVIRHHGELAAYFRSLCEENEICVVPFRKSNAITAIDLGNDAKRVYTVLKEQYDMELTPSGGDLENRILRVGHIGHLKKGDYDMLMQALVCVLRGD